MSGIQSLGSADAARLAAQASLAEGVSSALSGMAHPADLLGVSSAIQAALAPLNQSYGTMGILGNIPSADLSEAAFSVNIGLGADWKSLPASWAGVDKAIESLQEQQRAQLAIASRIIYDALPGLLGASETAAELASTVMIPSTITQLAELVDSVSRFAREMLPREMVDRQGVHSFDVGQSAFQQLTTITSRNIFSASFASPRYLSQASAFWKELAEQQRDIHALQRLLGSVHDWYGLGQLEALASTLASRISLLLLGATISYTVLLAAGATIIARLRRYGHNRLYGCFQCLIDAPRGPPLVMRTLTVGLQDSVFGGV